ncbi:MAG: tetratricopeptide repeat protein [Spirosomataceae bacterium]
MMRLSPMRFYTLCLGILCCWSGVLYAQNTLSYTQNDQHFKNGLEFFEKRIYPAARQEFENYLQGNKGVLETDNYNSVTAEYYMIVCALYMNYPEAELQADRFVHNHSEHPKSSQLYRELGLYYFTKEDYNKATVFLEKADPSQLSFAQSQETRFKLAMAYYNQQNLAKALPIFNEIKNNADDYAASASYYAGHINLRNENYDEAISDFKHIENHPNYRTEMPGLIANVYYRQKKYDALVAYTEPLLKNKRSGVKLDDLALLTAEVYYQKGNFEQAVVYYNQFASVRGNRMPAQAQFRYGYSLYRANDYKKAIDALKGVAANKDTVGQYASYYMGISHLKSDNPNAALLSFDQARKLKFNKEVQEEAAFNHAKIQLDLNKGTDAIKEFEEFLKTYPDSRFENEANELISESYLNSNNYSAALAYIEGLKRKTTRISAAYQRMAYNQGVIEFNGERFGQAIAYFDKSLQNPIDNDLKVSANFWKAEAFSGNRQYDEAIAQYNQLLRISDNAPSLTESQLRSRYGLGYAFFNQQQYDQALTHFKNYTDKLKTASNRLNYEDALARMGDCYFVNKNYNEAQKLYDQVLASGKTDKDYATYQKGLMLAYQDKGQEAKAAFDKVLTQYPSSRYVDDAMFQIGVIDLNSGNYQVAVRDFTRLIQQQNRSFLVPAALLKRAIAYSNLQSNEEAINDYKTILNKYPSSKYAQDAIAGVQDALNTVGRPEEFQEVLAQYKRANPGDGSLEKLEYETAKNLYYNEKYDKAITALLNYMQNYPGSINNVEAKYLLADSYYRTKDISNALRYYYIVIEENKSPNVNRAAQRAAEIEFANKNYQKAIRNYRVLTQMAGNKKDLVNAWTGLMESYYLTAKYDSVLVYTREIINAGSVNLGAQNKAMLYNGKVALAKGDSKKAIEEFEKTVAAAKDEIGAEAKYNIAEIQFKNKQYEVAKKTCYDFIDQFSNYDKWLDKNFLLLADIFIATNDTFQAKATLNSIIENSPNPETVQAAKNRLKGLDGK